MALEKFLRVVLPLLGRFMIAAIVTANPIPSARLSVAAEVSCLEVGLKMGFFVLSLDNALEF